MTIILTFSEASTSKPLVSQKFIETQMRQLLELITTSMDFMFEKLNQSVEYRLIEEINQLKERIDMHDLTTSTPHDAQGPSTSSMQNTSIEIKEIL